MVELPSCCVSVPSVSGKKRGTNPPVLVYSQHALQHDAALKTLRTELVERVAKAYGLGWVDHSFLHVNSLNHVLAVCETGKDSLSRNRSTAQGWRYQPVLEHSPSVQSPDSLTGTTGKEKTLLK